MNRSVNVFHLNFPSESMCIRKKEYLEPLKAILCDNLKLYRQFTQFSQPIIRTPVSFSRLFQVSSVKNWFFLFGTEKGHFKYDNNAALWFVSLQTSINLNGGCLRLCTNRQGLRGFFFISLPLSTDIS